MNLTGRDYITIDRVYTLEYIGRTIGRVGRVGRVGVCGGSQCAVRPRRRRGLIEQTTCIYMYKYIYIYSTTAVYVRTSVLVYSTVVSAIVYIY